MQGIFDFFGFLWLFGQNLTKIARGPQLKIFESGVSVLQHAVIYETHLFSAIIVFWKFGLAITACRETSVSYITACRWMRGNRVKVIPRTSGYILIKAEIQGKDKYRRGANRGGRNEGGANTKTRVAPFSVNQKAVNQKWCHTPFSKTGAENRENKHWIG